MLSQEVNPILTPWQIRLRRTGLFSTYRAVMATDACPMSVETALISTPFSIRLVANVRRPEWLDAPLIPAASYSRANSCCRVLGVKLPPFCDLSRAESVLNRMPSCSYRSAKCRVSAFLTADWVR